MFKKKKLALTQKEGKKKQPEKRPDLGEGKRVNVLSNMFVTFPTCHVERLPLKAFAD